MAAPTYPAAQDLAEGSGTRSFTAVTTTAGDYLVVEVGIEAGTSNVFQPSCTGLTFTKQNDTGSNSGDAQCVQWTAPDASGASRTVTITPGGGSSLLYRARLTVTRGSTGPGGKGVSASAQTVSVARTGNNSGVFMTVADFNVGAPGGSQTWTPGGTTRAVQQGSGATYCYGRWDDSGSSATASHGLSSPSFTGPSIAVLEMLGSSGGSVDLTPATAAFSAIALNPVPQPVTINLSPATFTLSGVALNPVPGQVTTSLTPATASFSAVAVTPVPQPVTINLSPATFTLSGIALSAVPGQVTTSISPAVGSFSAVAVTPVPQPVTINLTPATFTLTAIALSTSGTVNLNVAPATLTAVPLDPVPQPVTISLTPATFSLSGIALAFAGGGSVELTPAVLNLTSVALSSVPGQVTTTLTPAACTLSAIALTFPSAEPEVPDIYSGSDVPVVVRTDGIIRVSASVPVRVRTE